MGGGAHMKDIHELKDNKPLSFIHRGVAARVHLVYSEGAEHTHNSTILFLKEDHSPRNFD